jgi:hypothetical protein
LARFGQLRKVQLLNKTADSVNCKLHLESEAQLYFANHWNQYMLSNLLRDAMLSFTTRNYYAKLCAQQILREAKRGNLQLDPLKKCSGTIPINRFTLKNISAGNEQIWIHPSFKFQSTILILLW